MGSGAWIVEEYYWNVSLTTVLAPSYVNVSSLSWDKQPPLPHTPHHGPETIVRQLWTKTYMTSFKLFLSDICHNNKKLNNITTMEDTCIPQSSTIKQLLSCNSACLSYTRRVTPSSHTFLCFSNVT